MSAGGLISVAYGAEAEGEARPSMDRRRADQARYPLSVKSGLWRY